jgi:N-acetylmuramoyl-L-alanine amidase
MAAFAAGGCSTREATETVTSDSTVVEETESPWERVVVRGSVVNLRAGPGTAYEVMGQVRRGDTLDVMGVSRDWLKVYHAPQSLFAWIYEPLTESPGVPE